MAMPGPTEWLKQIFPSFVSGAIGLHKWRNTPISLSNLKEGDLVSITLITDHGGITDIFKIQLLGDEK